MATAPTLTEALIRTMGGKRDPDFRSDAKCRLWYFGSQEALDAYADARFARTLDFASGVQGRCAGNGRFYVAVYLDQMAG